MIQPMNAKKKKPVKKKLPQGSVGAGGRALGLARVHAVGTLTALGPDGQPIKDKPP